MAEKETNIFFLSSINPHFLVRLHYSCIMYFAGSRFVALLALAIFTPVAHCNTALQNRLRAELSPKLSAGAGAISGSAPARWNALGAPSPGAVVDVRTEADVAATVRGALFFHFLLHLPR